MIKSVLVSGINSRSHVQAESQVPTAEEKINICERLAGILGEGTWCDHTYSNTTIVPGNIQHSADSVDQEKERTFMYPL